jgi:hypothetical protein
MENLANKIQELADEGLLVSIEGYRTKEGLSRSGAVKKLSDKTKWLRVELDKRVFYLKKEEK